MARSPNSKKIGFGNVSFGSFTIPFDVAVELNEFFKKHPTMGRGDVMKEALVSYLERTEDLEKKANSGLKGAAKAEVERLRRQSG